jgi:hypothetical protein
MSLLTRQTKAVPPRSVGAPTDRAHPLVTPKLSREVATLALPACNAVLENAEMPATGHTSTLMELLAPARPTVPGVPAAVTDAAVFHTSLGAFVVDDCLRVLHQIPDDTIDLVITSPPYDGQPKYGNGEKYEREWYADFFRLVTAEILRTLKPHGSFILNYRSKRHGDERGTLQYELVFWLRDQGFLFCEDFVWGKPSPPPGRFNRFLKDAVEYCFSIRQDTELAVLS